MTQGLIYAFLLDGQGGAKALSWQQVKNWHAEQGELWLHLDYSQYEVKEWLFHESGLDISVAETLLSSESRPRCQSYAEDLLMAWRGINPNPTSDPDDMVAVRMWRDNKRLISTLKRDLQAINDVVLRLERGSGPLTLGELVIELADRMVWEISSVVEKFDDAMGDLEARVLESKQLVLRTELGNLRRQVIALRRYLSPQKEALMRLTMEKLAWIDSDDRILLREVVDRVTRALEDLEAIRERAMVAQEELQNRISEELNNRMYVLSIITAVFLPLGFLTGLLGINVGGIPGAENPQAFRYFIWIIIGLIVAQIMFFKWKRWF
ncbi:zinc transporter ZntB [Thiomicrorhabdus sediminis]|uniref:Zinc transporter ZntB n=1 Tax=Thiomicrorhabdus sediminis TaxID=2580412 RepID=A0A4P9K4R3_9GAMM|nr:zinc transporter ZntB [Thiomicrorhabdus sediminis]QCU89390.1 zinc transporter ZntB [Thiomicrorhabdus sediminis]